MERPQPASDCASDERCLCGALVARTTPLGVEILCRRCRRVHRIPWERVGETGRTRGRPTSAHT
ncbi:MAG: hypothetical protein DYG91_13625 [Chloroflexi bacterium CFX7]|nr:hypothetical protein [Chloroflexi bacterium CFX7]RIL04169.1 MAG: hypothetical protein DCC78_00860 [bacterium]